MKLVIKSIITLLIITLSACAQIKSKTQGNNYADGFSGAELMFEEMINFLDHKVEKEKVKCKFNPKLIVDGTGESKFAMIFDFEKAPSDIAKKYLTHMSGNKYAMYFRNVPNIDLFMKKRDSFGLTRRLEIHFYTDSGVSRDLWIHFPDSMLSHYITSYQLTQTLNSIKERVNRQVTALKSSKKIVIDSCTALKENAKFIAKAKEGKAAVEAEVKAAEKKNNDLKSVAEGKQKELEALQGKVREAMAALEKAQNAVQAKTAEIEQIAIEVETTAKNIETSKANSADSKALVAKYQAAEDRMKAEVKAENAKMKSNSVGTAAAIDACTNSAINTMDAAATKTACNKFRPKWE